MTVEEARLLIKPAINDQLKRQLSMHQTLKEIAEPPMAMQGKAKEVLALASQVAKGILEEYEGLLPTI